MKKTCLRLTSSSMLATTSVFAIGLARPSLPKVFQTLSWLAQAQVIATEKVDLLQLKFVGDNRFCHSA